MRPSRARLGLKASIGLLSELAVILVWSVATTDALLAQDLDRTSAAQSGWGTLAVQRTSIEARAQAPGTVGTQRRPLNRGSQPDPGVQAKKRNGPIVRAQAIAPSSASSPVHADVPEAAQAQALPAPSQSVAAIADANAKSPAYISAVERFCSSIGIIANDARVAWHRRTLAELEAKIDQRVARLDAKIAEHKEWLGKRQAFAEKVRDAMVQVFIRMNSESAALQVAEMDDHTAAALIMKLNPKVAAPILGEVPAAKAARIAQLLAAAVGGPESGIGVSEAASRVDQDTPVNGKSK